MIDWRLPERMASFWNMESLIYIVLDRSQRYRIIAFKNRKWSHTLSVLTWSIVKIKSLQFITIYCCYTGQRCSETKSWPHWYYIDRLISYYSPGDWWYAEFVFSIRYLVFKQMILNFLVGNHFWNIFQVNPNIERVEIA